MLLYEERVYGSCLIARKGDDLLRYLFILDSKDRIVTIRGPDAEGLKESLKGSLSIDGKANKLSAL